MLASLDLAINTKWTIFLYRFTTPQRRAEHNATERARRESLNGKFRLLASALPNLQACNRPSKNQIIEKALEWVEHSLYREHDYISQIRMLQQENKCMTEHIQKQEQCWTMNMLPSPPQSVNSSIVLMPTMSTTVANANIHVPDDGASAAAAIVDQAAGVYYSVVPAQTPAAAPPQELTCSPTTTIPVTASSIPW